MRASCLLASMLVVAALPAAPASGPELLVQDAPGLESFAARIAALSKADFERELELAGVDGFGPPIHVVLAREGSQYSRAVPRWASAFTVPDRSLIVLFPHRTPTYPDSNLEATLRHELMHVLVWRAARGRHVPRWFNEGLATIAGREWGMEDRARHALAIIGKGPRSASELERAFTGDSVSAARAYALSAALTRSLIRRHGSGVPPRILSLLAEDVPFPSAFRQATGTTVSAELDHFFGSEALWFTWVPFLTSTGVIWSGITILALVAIRRRRQRNAELHARWELEEQLEAKRRLRRADHEDRWTVN